MRRRRDFPYAEIFLLYVLKMRGGRRHDVVTDCKYESHTRAKYMYVDCTHNTRTSTFTQRTEDETRRKQDNDKTKG